MNVIEHVLGFFGYHPANTQTHEALKADLPAPQYSKRSLTLVAPEHVPVAAEVDNDRQRYTAKRYIEHMKACENGDRRGFKEWSKFILTMKYQRPDDYASWQGEVDELIARGELWNVLTPEEEAERVRNVLAKLDYIHSMAYRDMHSSDAPEFDSVAAEMEAAAVKHVDDVLAMQDLPAWPEDIEEGDHEEEDEDPEVEFEIEVGEDEPQEDDDACVRSEGR